MDNTGSPKKPIKVSEQPPVDDIPAALRDTPAIRRRYRLKPSVLVGGMVALGAIGLLVGILFPRPANQSSDPNSAQGETQQAATNSQSDTVLGHFAYQEAPASELQSIARNGRIQLRKATAKQFKAMVAAARDSGVILVPLSGFRSVSDQQRIFFDTKAQRGQAASERAQVSAPPGYSEHHTGYAVDIGDGNVPATNLSPDFEKTAAFKWLQANAARFSFEMSFPRNNARGVSYEPWHWRYVGDRDSLETFYKAKHSVNNQ